MKNIYKKFSSKLNKLNMKNLHVIEDQIESLTIKFSIYNE